MKQLGNRIKDLREAKELSPEGLAEIMGLAKSTVWAYESGKKQVSVVHLKKLAVYFQVSVDSLLNRSEQKINADLQGTTFLDDYNFMLDDQALNQQEIDEVASFIQVKRRVGLL